MSRARQNALAFIFGVAATLTLPPFFIFPLIVVAYGGLYYLLQSSPSARRSFWIGWWWGWGFYITGLYWFCIALLTDPDKFAWLIPFALFALTGVIAIYSGIACLIYHRLRVKGVADIILFATVWLGVEFARGYLFTGFPWNLAGYSMSFSVFPLQLASVFGAYGLTWIVVCLGVIPAAIRLNYPRAKLYTFVAYAFFAVGCGWGAWRLADAERIPEDKRYVENVTLRLVQANISQHHKWDPKLQFDGLKQHIALMQSPGLDKVTHILWPETAIPYVVQEHSALTRLLGEALPKDKILISGALHSEGEDARWQLWNSVVVINHQGEIVGKYDKHKLVPFGEFLPFRSLLPAAWLTPVGDKDFDAGPGPQSISWPGLPLVSPLICYEAIFPGLAVGPMRPDILMNLTNDAWFGMSTGPYQHFEMARMRAVEQGLPLIRVANTGISAVVDAYGRIQGRLELGEKGFLDAKLPTRLASLTNYVQYRDRLLWTLLIAVTIVTLRQRKTFLRN